MRNRILLSSIFILTALALSACGGGSSSGSSTIASLSTGQVVDAPVNGLSYVCGSGSNSGISEGSGNFYYVAGSTCTFSLGNIGIGYAITVPSDGIVTPYDLAKVSRQDVSNIRAIAIAQILQSLDTAENSLVLTIPASVRQALTALDKTNLIPVGADPTQAQLLAFLQKIGISKLVTPTVARDTMVSYLSKSKVSLATGSSPMLYMGINLSGGEFNGGQIPGVVPNDYFWPTTEDVTYFKSKGMNIIRIPILWERLQPTLNGAFNTSYLSGLTTLVNAIKAAGMTAIIDVHNYGYYPAYQPNTYNAYGNLGGYTNYVGGASGPTNAQFADLWTKLAQLWANDSQVIFGLMNEPANMPTATWLSAANAGIAAIRSSTGGNANNLILVPGNCWTGGWSWVGGGGVSPCNTAGADNGTVMLGVIDSRNNYAFDIHQYLDSNESGTNGQDCTQNGSTILSSVTQWLRTNNKRAFLGEFAGINSPACQTVVTNMLTYMNANAGSPTTGGWIGWAWWGAGPYYSYLTDGFYLEPSNWYFNWTSSSNAVWTTPQPPVDQTQMSWLSPFLQ